MERGCIALLRLLSGLGLFANDQMTKSGTDANSVVDVCFCCLLFVVVVVVVVVVLVLQQHPNKKPISYDGACHRNVNLGASACLLHCKCHVSRLRVCLRRTRIERGVNKYWTLKSLQHKNQFL